MKFYEVQPALEDGKKIRRHIWDEKLHVEMGRCSGGDEKAYMKSNGGFFHASCEELMADDWEIIDDTKQTNSKHGVSAYEQWISNQIKEYEDAIKECRDAKDYDRAATFAKERDSYRKCLRVFIRMVC